MTDQITNRVQANELNRGQPRVAADAFVLAGRPLLPGVRLADTSRFGDDVWHLKHAQVQRQQSSLVMNFEQTPERFRQTAKETVYTLMVGDLPPGCESIRAIVTIRGYWAGLQTVLVWMAGSGIPAVSAITSADVEAFARHTDGLRISQDSRDAYHRALRLLWLCRTKISDPLAFDPAVVVAGLQQGKSRSVTRRTRENATDRIPEQVLSPYLVWALRWINDFADDVIDAHDEWRQLNRWASPSRRRRGQKHVGRHQVGRLVGRVLNRYRAEGRPLPGWQGEVNLSHLARESRVERTSLGDGTPSGSMIREAAAELGIADATYLRTPVRGLLDGEPWRGPIEYTEVEHLTRMLQAACYIVISFLSGMRDSEVKHIKRGCVTVWRDEDGHIVRRRLTSLAFKGESEETGVEATWIVNASAQRAVEVLERLQPARRRSLFALLPPSRAYIGQGEKNEARTTSATNADMVAFGKWINAYCHQTGRDETVPLVNKQDWKITTSQFRRTLAWFIARRPGGVIAGALQFRHLRVQMFEGYAGTSDSGFRDEVEAEDAIARGEKLGDLIISHEFHSLRGPAAGEAESRLAEFERNIQFHGKVFNDEKRLRRHMNRYDPHIYPGEYVTCVHNPDRALCRPSDGAEGPSLPDCQPLRCRNVALTSDNIARMREALAAYGHKLAQGEHLAPLIRHRLETRRQEIADFLATTAGTGDHRD
ncbi:hypothetical protein [Streptomyces buecherae]|uniref:Integrase n=1 Tax=Streptomyces buecherae TaxID=2763006 RepID=A0A7H8NDW1_9ACTN|nr:hypothetical protein [Streptomyces buecherae]QKW52667.1 hypothetical protein HUT08_27530 [Streptomyces buecherae]